MLVSEDGGFIFISNPKTGTSSFQRSILKIDKSAKLNKFFINGNNFHIAEHSNLNKIIRVTGYKHEKYIKIVFIRDIYEKAVSSYFFYVNGKPLTRGKLLNYANSFSVFIRAIKTQLSVLIARILPFSIWSLVWPIKRNSKYILDSNNNIRVNYIANTESLSEDIYTILKAIDYPYIENLQLNKTNTSNHKKTDEYFTLRLHRVMFKIKYKKEIQLFNMVKNKKADFNYLQNK